MEPINGCEKIINKTIEQLDFDPKKYCYNLGINKSLDFSIYRFISLDDFFEIIINKKLTLVRTSLWDDVYENFLLKLPIKDGTNLTEYIDGMYGQCWTRTKESDALWRIYSPGTKSVRIRTTLKSLLISILKSKDYSLLTNIGFSAGIVSYHNIEYLKSISSNIDLVNLIGNATGIMLRSLFLKREEFAHEQEVRIIFRETVSEDYSECKKQIIKQFQIEPNALVAEVTFDPRCTERFYTIYSQAIRLCGFLGLINKSELYLLK